MIFLEWLKKLEDPRFLPMSDEDTITVQEMAKVIEEFKDNVGVFMKIEGKVIKIDKLVFDADFGAIYVTNELLEKEMIKCIQL